MSIYIYLFVCLDLSACLSVCLSVCLYVVCLIDITYNPDEFFQIAQVPKLLDGAEILPKGSTKCSR